MRGVVIAVAVAGALGAALLVRTAPDPRQAELEREFARGVALLQQHDAAGAAAALHRVLRVAPQLPEAHVNLGYAMLDLGRAKEARVAFDQATTLRPMQANAYYGLALAHEALGERDAATGAMRSYLHLAREASPEHLRRARAALWEWEQQRPH